MSERAYTAQPGESAADNAARWMRAACGHANAVAEAGLALPGSAEARITPEQKNTLRQVGQQGLDLAGIRYGSGAPNYAFTIVGPENRKILWYNAMRHDAEVGQDGMRLATHLRLGSLARYASLAAGDWHDIDQTAVIADPANRDGSDELHSAQELLAVLRQHDLPPEAACWAAYFILGTRVITEDNRVVGQVGATMQPQDFPSREAWLAARVGASADLGRLYSGFDVAYGLFPQRLGLEYPQVPDLGDPATRRELHGFIQGQLGFLANHRYPLTEAEELFGGNRTAVVAHTESLLRQAEQDMTPGTWQEFTAQQSSAARRIVAA